MSGFRKILPVLLLPALFCGCASLGLVKTDGERIRAQGTAVYMPANPEGSRRAALAAAQRNAVEQALGVFVSGQTRVRKAELIDSKIVAASAGFIKSFVIEEERRDGDVYRVSIRAVVLLDRMDRELNSLNLEDAPPLAVVLVASAQDESSQSGLDAARAVEQSLSKRGFSVIAADAAQPSVAQALSAARAAGAGYLAYVQSKAYKIDGGPALGEGLYPYRARVSVRIAAVSNGSVVSEDAREAGGLDVSEAVAARKAQSAAAELAASSVAPSLELAAKSSVKSVDIYVTGLSGLPQLTDFRKAVSSLPAVEDCRLKSYGSGDAVFALRLDSSDPEEFAAAIMHSVQFQLALISVTPYEVRLKAN
ncbi:MAG: hypothetical protein GX410_08905 [Elusimicrobia bacterium]|nr:hypothetical protein [Elusimicrobiota bacterium]